MKNTVAERHYYYLICLFVLGTIGFCSGSPKLVVTNDGPAILDSVITFNATLHNPDRSEYTIYWNEGGPFSRSWTQILNKTNNYTSTWTLKYTSNSKFIGQFAVTVNVGYFSFLQWFVTVDTQIIRYLITDRFSGTLDVWQDGQLREGPDILVSTKNEVTLMVNVHDPSHYLETANNVTYSWYNQTSFITNTTSPFLKKNFTKEADYSYNVTLTAVFNSSIVTDETANATTPLIKIGIFRTSFKVKSAIANLTVAGSTWFPHGKLLKLNVTCTGSGPYTYCWMLKTGPYNRTGNETCPSEQLSTNDCQFFITRYFQEPGIYSLLVILENEVSKVVNQSTINIYIVHRKQQLSIIVVPVSCSIIAVVLIVFGIAYYIENQVKYTVEVADFDFGQDAEIPYMTFCERLRNAMSSPTSSNSLLVPSTSEDDQEPILTSN